MVAKGATVNFSSMIMARSKERVFSQEMEIKLFAQRQKIGSASLVFVEINRNRFMSSSQS